VVLVVVGGAVLWWLKPWVRDVVVLSPGSTGKRITESGLLANYYPAKERSGPGILLLGGSEGGIGRYSVVRALDLQSEGFSVLVPSYFGGPGQRRTLELVPLEVFDRALDWLRRRPEVHDDSIAVVGHSKGAEAALLVGVRHPELSAVVAGAPSSVVWAGIDWYSPFNPDSSWSSDGRALSSLSYGLFKPWQRVGRVYEDGLEHLAEHPDAEIPIERIKSPVLLMCGENDTLWPACPMSRHLRARSVREGGPRVEVLVSEDAGHSAFGPRLRTGHPDLHDRWSGGSAAANNAARTRGWRLVVEFLREHLRAAS
jgi:dienelactone hydrolase